MGDEYKTKKQLLNELSALRCQQKTIAERLRESEAELDIISRNVYGIIYTLSPEGKFMYVSQGWTETLGQDIDQVKNHHFDDFVHPDYVPACQSFLEKVLTTGKPQKGLEYQVKHRDASWRWHTSSGAPVKDENDKSLYYVGLAVDITDRKHAEAALRVSEEKFSLAFHSIPDPVTITTLDKGYYVEVNDAWVESVGYERHEAIGRTGVELLIWSHNKERELMLEEIQRTGSIRNYPAIYRNKSGEFRLFHVSAQIINMENKPHLLCVHKDITDNTRIREELHVSEERFSKAFNASPSTMSITTLEEGRYIDINESFCRIVGYSHDQIQGRTSLEMGFWSNPNDRMEIIQKIMNNEPVREVEFYYRRKSGEERLGLYSAERIDINDEACLLSIITDITERRKAEDDIRYLSFHDTLTGLHNRAYFENQLKRIDTGRQLPISLILGDVNGLKLINDVLGHQEGDKVLITVANLLKSSCRQEDIVARWGGDEFIILLPGCDIETASIISERVKNDCSRINDLPIETSLSVGLSCKSVITQDIREIIKEAEDKMYRNKLLENRSTRSSFLNSLKRTLWTRSHETEAHCQRIAETTHIIGQAIHLPDSELDNLRLLSVLHDIGKIAIPNSILDKPGKLSPEEWESIKKHPEIGYRIALSSPEMAPIAEAILHHHERWDGTGYPLGLKNEEIPLISRIIAIADAYDVMINGRPYQKAVSPEEVWQEIARCAGSQFDPNLVSITLDLFAKSHPIACSNL